MSWITWLALVVVLLLLAAIAIPNFVRARVTTAPNACVNHLRQIDGAKQQWALENRKGGAEVPAFSDLVPYLGRGTSAATHIVCPAGGSGVTFESSYEIGAVTNPPRCKILPEQHVLQ